MIAIFDNDDTEYAMWISAYPESYVVNMRRGYSPSYMVPHHGRRPTVSPVTSLRAFALAVARQPSSKRPTTHKRVRRHALPNSSVRQHEE
ncbi:hypothetical protein [Frateuria sp. Soil773]|uniref:hypothetical protein n=1 Tax=Frateuria sp. Soil773 TaxID=1736407 RepID=UPI0012F7C6F6|nr:hypothetical protein [Frateuria sp. Soil773]